MLVREGESNLETTFEPLNRRNKSGNKRREPERRTQSKEGKLWEITPHNSEKSVTIRFPLIRQKR